MIPSWPDVLPRPERKSLTITRQDGRLKRTTESGPPSYRRRFSAVVKPVSLAILLDRDQVDVFEHFYAVTTKEGSLPFWMPDPTTDGWPLLMDDGSPLLMDDDTPILLARLWLCQFGDEAPQETIPVGLTFRMAFSVVVMP